MAHLAIYRKWRPMTFDDIVGQTHITRTLKNQILTGTVGHAYLFCGTRGTGKTTCAKVLSRAVNCLNPKDGNPCNECEVCRGITDGSIMDVTEMDAASNNGVEDIRGLKEDINYVASAAKYTVYIIDEVHMLSTSAFNALLKTLEEPPENVLFILATTEAHKVPQTILSRCQRFDFRRIRAEDIIIRMKEIAAADGYRLSEDAFRMLAGLADGSLRDGLSIMERVISACGNEVTAEAIVNTLGISTADSVFKLTDAFINGDSAAVIECVDRAVSDGKDLTQLAEAVLSHFRSLMICKLSGSPETMLDTDAKTAVRLKAQSERLTFEKINHASSVIAQAMSDARLAKSARIIYELAFIKLARPEMDMTPQGLMDRLSELERRSQNAASQPAAARAAEIDAEILSRLSAVEQAIKNGAAAKPSESEPKPEPQIKKKVSHRLYNPIPKNELTFDYPTAKLARNWQSTVDTMKRENAAYAVPLAGCSVTFDAESLILIAPESGDMFTYPMIASHLREIRELFRRITGSPYTIKISRRADLDDEHILNPFDLPRREADDAGETKPDAERNEDKSEAADKLDEFVAKFAGIIIDGDKFIPGSEPDAGFQSSFEDIDDDREEFLEEKEIASDEEDEI